jgi:hypothetical protein
LGLSSRGGANAGSLLIKEYFLGPAHPLFFTEKERKCLDAGIMGDDLVGILLFDKKLLSDLNSIEKYRL